MENCSENKRGRGRPRKYADAAYHHSVLAGSAITLRGQQNCISGETAAEILSGYQKAHQNQIFAYLLTPPGRKTILAHLGRMDAGREGDKNRIISAAKRICAERMKTATAVGYIRLMRGMVKPLPWKLLAEIQLTIQKYCDCHENVSPDEIERALRVAAQPYKNNLQGELGLLATVGTNKPPKDSQDEFAKKRS